MDYELCKLNVQGARPIETIQTFNDAIRVGRVYELHPPRRRLHHLKEFPPFYVIAVRLGISITMDGLDVDHNGRVLRRNSTSSSLNQPTQTTRDVRKAPIPGLFAAESDIGNIHYRNYLGGLAMALVTGSVAGIQASSMPLRSPDGIPSDR